LFSGPISGRISGHVSVTISLEFFPNRAFNRTSLKVFGVISSKKAHNCLFYLGNVLSKRSEIDLAGVA
jgi:hypothetical protein